MTNSEITHLWAHQAKTRARSSGRNLFFEGKSIYSFGHHFEIARIIERKKIKAVLFTTRRWGQRTARHIQLTHRAIPPNMPVFNVDSFTDTPKMVMDKYRKRVEEILIVASRARTHKASYLLNAQRVTIEANRYAEYFGLRTRLKAVDEDAIAKAVKDNAKAIAEEKVKNAARNAEIKRQRELREIELQKQLGEWLKGDRPHISGYELPATYLRINPNNPEAVQTSRGATVPLSHVRRLLPHVLKIIDSGIETDLYQTPARLGHYKIDRIGADGMVHAGCHHFKAEEVKRFASVLGITQSTPVEPIPADELAESL